MGRVHWCSHPAAPQMTLLVAVLQSSTTYPDPVLSAECRPHHDRVPELAHKRDHVRVRTPKVRTRRGVGHRVADVGGSIQQPDGLRACMRQRQEPSARGPHAQSSLMSDRIMYCNRVEWMAGAAAGSVTALLRVKCTRVHMHAHTHVPTHRRTRARTHNYCSAYSGQWGECGCSLPRPRKLMDVQDAQSPQLLGYTRVHVEQRTCHVPCWCLAPPCATQYTSGPLPTSQRGRPAYLAASAGAPEARPSAAGRFHTPCGAPGPAR